MSTEQHYVPAMGKRWMLPLYDVFSRFMGARRVHAELLDRARIEPGMRVLEIGCGTGNLLRDLGRRVPGVESVGIDPDPAALGKARRKAARANLSIRYERGFAGELPLPDDSFDRVLSSLMLHHLEPGELTKALGEVRRVLRPGGEFHVVDIVSGHRHVADLPFLNEEGLTETGRSKGKFGVVAFYRASQ